jgi:hypothetical protein
VFRVFFGPLVDMGLWQIINVQDIPIVDPPWFASRCGLVQGRMYNLQKHQVQATFDTWLSGNHDDSGQCNTQWQLRVGPLSAPTQLLATPLSISLCLQTYSNKESYLHNGEGSKDHLFSHMRMELLDTVQAEWFDCHPFTYHLFKWARSCVFSFLSICPTHICRCL